MIIFHISHTATIAIDLQVNGIQQKMKSLANIDKMATRVSESVLPIPYNYLLTQPLMTKGVEKYYQRTPIIHTIYAKKNKSTNTYYRAVMMLLDRNKARNDVHLAQKKKDLMVVELAFITMNFNELPKKVISDVLNTNIPLGKSLFSNHVKTFTKDCSYISIRCDKVVFSLTHCKVNSKLYGRTNTIVRADNKRWIAQVVEILPGFLR